MSLIHYLLFVPPTLIGSFYLGYKMEKEIPFLKNNRLLFVFYWMILFIIFLVSTITLSPIMVFLLYSCMLFFISDILSFLFKKLKWKKGRKVLKKLLFHGIPVLGLSFVITLFGLYNASNPIIRNVVVTVDKEMDSPLKIVMLTDLHLGTGTKEEAIDRIVRDTNLENADLFVLVGDIFDERTSDELKNYLYQQFKLIETTYGSYFVEGNHDLLTDDLRESFEESNITVLEDESLLIDSKFYLVGRLDKKEERLSLSTIVSDVDFKFPVILLNHRPDDIRNAKELGIDLQLSGHTHAGQLFPANFVLQHGYYQLGNFHLVVSPGYGNWGMPIRTYGRNELVVITLYGTN